MHVFVFMLVNDWILGFISIFGVYAAKRMGEVDHVLYFE